MVKIWLSLALLSLLIELFTPGSFFFLSFMFGFFGLAGLVYYDPTLSVLELTIFFITFFSVSLLLLRSFLKRNRYSQQQKEEAVTNVYALAGKIAIITSVDRDQKFSGTPYRVQVEGEFWPARTMQEEQLQLGQQVRILRVQGNHLLVQAVE